MTQTKANAVHCCPVLTDSGVKFMSEEPITGISAGRYSVRQMRRRDAEGLKFWVENETGEGMEVTEQMVADMLEAFFKHNF